MKKVVVQNKFSPEFTAIQRELTIAVELIGSGVTLLNKSNLMAFNYYWTAFFNLANGLERAAKVIITIDHYMDTHKFLTNDELKDKYGHDLGKLMKKIKEIHKQKCCADVIFPSKSIHDSIISVLSFFAKTTRYYNLDFLAGDNTKDPILAWDENVKQKVLELHPPPQDKKTNFSLDDNVFCLVTGFDGNIVESATELLRLQKQRSSAIKYERMYILQIARTFLEIAQNINPEPPHIPYMTEILCRFGLSDKYFKSKKIWSPCNF